MYLHKLKHMVKVNLPKVLAIHAKCVFAKICTYAVPLIDVREFQKQPPEVLQLY